MQLIFVYGSLKRGFHNHAYFLNREPLFLARLDGYQLLDRNVGYPAITKGPSFVEGEVYEVNEKELNLLDQLESHPSYYRRTELIVSKLGSNDILSVMGYVIVNPSDWTALGAHSWVSIKI
jgi:gamma-glutamylcyclotransferase (GGCT)/AIG2-like uncharacterized protein YtfP